MRFWMSLIVLWLGLIPACGGVFSIPLLSARASAQDHAALVPPYPGPVPTSWPSVDQYERYAEQREGQLAARQHALLAAGRPAHYRLKHTSLLAVFAVGTAVALTGFVVLWTHTADQQREHAAVSRSAFGAMLAGAGLALAGGFGAHTIKSRNVYNDEIEHLRQERSYWTHEVRRVKRERSRSGYDLSLHGLGLHVAF
ncbi:MAG: hypothetical protein JWN48_4583 [Myxococcaceae bacterium]|nr:hypothetical protein [Myxococcaceae bacterium]